jgi:hypothetical protein
MGGRRKKGLWMELVRRRPSEVTKNLIISDDNVFEKSLMYKLVSTLNRTTGNARKS